MTRYRISAHFTVEEFDCHDGTTVPTRNLPALRLWAEVWGEPLRERFGPVRVSSGFRTRDYNAKVGGAPSSYHRYDLRRAGGATSGTLGGVAADVVPARGGPDDWERWALARMASTGWRLGRTIGAAVAYPRLGFIHLDTGNRRIWAG